MWILKYAVAFTPKAKKIKNERMFQVEKNSNGNKCRSSVTKYHIL